MAHLKDNEFGVVVKVDLIGMVRLNKAFDNRHTAKSKAGKIFHLDFVKSVYVFDADGVGYLYLKKNIDGSVYREELTESGCETSGYNLKSK